MSDRYTLPDEYRTQLRILGLTELQIDLISTMANTAYHQGCLDGIRITRTMLSLTHETRVQ